MRPRSQQNPKSSFGSWGLAAAAIAGMTVPMAIVAPVRAAVLHSWSFDPGTRAFTFTLPDGVKPDFFLMAEPARIVLEIPDTTLGAVPAAQQYNGAVRSIRLSEVSGGSRVVVELAPNTRLDPRHAELTPTALGNGQTAWTLRPLLQDVPTAPVAAAPSPPEPAVSAPAAVPPTVAAPPAIAEAPLEPAVESADETAANEATAESTEAASPDAETVAAEDGLTEIDEAIAPEPADSAIAIEVNPSPDLAAAPPTAAPPDLPSLPDIANSATTGAARSLPTGPDPLARVSTDADVLTQTPGDTLSDLPPEQLPLDPFATSPSVSVPDLAEADRTPAPAVAVPPLADVPDAPVATQNSGSTAAPSADVPPDQVRPPANRPAAAPPVTATAPPTAPPSAPEAIAANSIEVPTIPLPPESWSDRGDTDTGRDPSQVRPPATEATTPAPAVITSPPPTAASSSSPSPPFLTSPPPTAPPRAPATPPAPPVERPSIPPPPSAARELDTVPFGAPLPQTKSLGEVDPSEVAGPQSVLPPGTRLPLQYVGANPLVLAEQEPVYEVLVVAQDVYDPATGMVVLPSGTQVLGRFEGGDHRGRYFVAQAIVVGRDRLPLVAASERLPGVPQPDSVEVALGSGIGAAAMTLLTGFSGIGLLGGAAMGAFAGLAESPSLVTIAPGTVIEVVVVADSPPTAGEAPTITQRPPAY